MSESGESGGVGSIHKQDVVSATRMHIKNVTTWDCMNETINLDIINKCMRMNAQIVLCQEIQMQ